jgi:hypothetical protein
MSDLKQNMLVTARKSALSLTISFAERPSWSFDVSERSRLCMQESCAVGRAV